MDDLIEANEEGSKDIEHMDKEARMTVKDLEECLRNLDDTEDFKRNPEELMDGFPLMLMTSKRVEMKRKG